MLPIKDNNPTTLTPWVTWGLIAVNIVVFVMTLTLGQRGIIRANIEFGAIPAVLFGHVELPPEFAAFPPGFEFLTIFTAMFMHGGWMHVGGNMLYLWVFGNNVEDAMGHWRFLFFYLLCGVAAALGHALADTTSQIPMIGASGALAGVLGAYFLLFPKARVLVWFFWVLIFYVPAVVVLGFWIGMQVINLSTGVNDGVAWAAHVAGFAAGLILIPLFKYRHIPLWQGGPKQQPVFGVYRPGRHRAGANSNGNGPEFRFDTPPWAAAYEREKAERRNARRGFGKGPHTTNRGDNGYTSGNQEPWTWQPGNVIYGEDQSGGNGHSNASSTNPQSRPRHPRPWGAAPHIDADKHDASSPPQAATPKRHGIGVPGVSRPTNRRDND
ncbi:rhomboid family intramembrane serine protease [Thalassospira marina]|uniref:Rhomboid family intramembrane serine protease n=1 Tax=Thalassospira marina TaxID=2048283 RepID=A0ABM6QBX2_9PROT|nr:rhomboid family intramembrane serine protease [Thalassospira marina]AUG53963.1 rhomboid family intramembrane serine protease [Thalassospira marina]